MIEPASIRRLAACLLAWWMGLAVIGSVGTASGGDDAETKRRNVLFIAVDDMRVELNCYGQKWIKSPHIDALAARGTLFRRAYCQQAVCNPSRASMLTGLRPSTLGIWDLPTHFRQRVPEVVTLPQLFKRQGYHTRNIGKIFHNWRQDDYRGDAPSWSTPAVMHYARHGDDRAEVAGKLPDDLAVTPKCEIRDVPDEAYFDGRIAARATRALRELSEQEQPWFLAVGFWKPHAHFNAPKKYWDLYDRAKVAMPENPEPPKHVPELAMHDGREILRAYKGRKPTAAEVRAMRHGYYAAISYVDAQIGKVVSELDRLNLAENTVIVFWSDHGFHLGEHALWAKTSNFELDAHVPLIIAAPNQPAGQQTDAIVELLDVYPTLVELCGLPAQKQLEGISLKPLLEDANRVVKPAAFTWHPRPAYPSAGKPPKAMGFSMRTGRYRYTEWRDFATGRTLARELYDHAADPRETENIVSSADAKTLAELARQLAETQPRRAQAKGSESK